jgi:lipid-binding SYLF domain-containing protein
MWLRGLVVAGIAIFTLTIPRGGFAAAEVNLKKNAEAALDKLYAKELVAKLLSDKAKAILVFPNIFKAGFLGGAHYGEGVLFQNGQVAGYYNSVAGSFGLQAGAQVFGYAMFLMSDQALEYLDRSDGWEVGMGPSIVVVGTGMGKSITSTTITQDAYAFIFNQQGLMAGLGIQGSKITKMMVPVSPHEKQKEQP